MELFWLYAVLFAIPLNHLFCPPYPSLFSYIRGRGCLISFSLVIIWLLQKQKDFLFFLIVPGAGGGFLV